MRFRMKSNFGKSPIPELRDPTGGLIARYLPGLGYRVTAQNSALVEKMIADGLATLDDADNPAAIVGAGRGKVSARVSVRSK